MLCKDVKEKQMHEGVRKALSNRGYSGRQNLLYCQETLFPLDPEDLADLLRQAAHNATFCGESTIHGIMLPAKLAEILSPAIDEAVDHGIPVLTFLSDAPASRRSAFVGTNNTIFGEQLANDLVKIQPNGGTCIVIASPYDNIMEQTRAFQAELQAEGGWTELSTSPLVIEFDVFRSLQQDVAHQPSHAVTRLPESLSKSERGKRKRLKAKEVLAPFSLLLVLNFAV